MFADARLALLGGLELTVGRHPVPLALSAQRVIAFLALHERPVTRSFIAGTLWGEATDDRARACLRSALWRLRRLRWVIVKRGADVLALDHRVAVDIHELRRVAHDLVDRSVGADEDLIEPLTSPGELLPDWDDDWVVSEREGFRQLRLHALEALSERLSATGRFGRAVEVGLAAVVDDPLRESARRTLIRVHLAEGNVVEAVAQYETYRKLLHDELGIEPSPQIEELVSGFRAVRSSLS